MTRTNKSTFIATLPVLIRILILLLPGVAFAQKTIHVPADYSTIQAAINASSAGDTVLVAAGTYKELIDFKGKSITVASESDPKTTIIDGDAKGTVVTFKTQETQTSVLRGFTITNGRSTNGGGIVITYASPKILNNIVRDNLGGCDGDGISIYGGAPLIQGNTISHNGQYGCSGGNGGGGIGVLGAPNGIGPQIIGNTIDNNTNYTRGGAISMNGAGMTLIQDNLIFSNSGASAGGAISMINTSSARIINNLMVGNSANQGGAIYWLIPTSNPGILVLNNTIVGNRATQGGQIFADGYDGNARIANNIIVSTDSIVPVYCGNFNDTNNPTFTANDVFNGSAAAYEGICGDPTGTNGNVSVDPQFVDAANQNYRLLSQSPVIDAGANTIPEITASDLAGDARKFDGNNDGTATIDIGAYEYNGVTEASLSTASITFPDQLVGTSSSAQTVVLTNTGTKPFDFKISATGDFAQTNDCSSTLGLATGAACNISVTFSPAARGTRTGDLQVIGNVADSPLLVSLTGKGIAPIAGVAPTSLTLADQLVGSTSTPQSITLSNTGDAPLSITSIVVTGDFAESHTCSQTLAPGATCTIAVTFSPIARGVRSGTVVITDDAPGTPRTIQLSGSGTGPDLSVAPLTFQFAPQLVGTSSASQAITVTSTGEVPVSLNGTGISGDFTQHSNCPASLPNGQSCTIDVVFSPTAKGLRTGVLTILHNAAGSPTSVTLSGIATAPVVLLSNTTISFGNQPLNTSATRVLTLSNTGNGPLTINSIAVGGSFPLTTTCGQTLAINATCNVTLTFAPTLATTYSGMLTLTDSAPDSPQIVPLSGTGTVVGVSPNLLAFPSQLVGTLSTSQPVILANNGANALTIQSVTTSGDFSADASGCGTALAAGANCTILVAFKPTATGNRTGTLTVNDNSSGSPRVALLSGTGIAPIIMVNPGALNFPSQLLNTTSVSQSVQVTNSGSAPLVISGVTTSGDFAQTNDCSTVAVNADCTIMVTFTPTASGTRTGTLTITPTVGTPQTLALTGTGITSYTQPAVTNISPTSAAAGAASLTLTVSGSNFVRASEVRWNGSGLPTTFVSASTLKAAVDASQLLTLAPVQVTVVTPAPGGGTSSPAFFTIYKEISLQANDLVYDTSARRIYASVGSAASVSGNSIVTIDPFNETAGTGVFVGSDPGKLALSADNNVLYVALNGAAAVRKFDVTTQTAGLQFTLGSDSFLGPMYAEDIAVSPSDSNVVAISRKYLGVSPKHAGVAIFEGGVARSNVTPGHTGSNVIEFSSSADTLYGYNNETTDYGFRRMTVNSSGVTIKDSTGNLISGFGLDIAFDNGKIYATNGAIVDPTVPSLAGTFWVNTGQYGLYRSVRPVSEINRTYFLDFNISSANISAFNQTTMTAAGSVTLPLTSSSASPLVHWGVDGLAFRTATSVVLVRTALIPWPLTKSTSALSFADQMVGTHSSDQTITLTNDSTAAIAITDLSTTGDFAQTNNCGTSISAGGRCAVTVTFNPTVAGSRSGALNIAYSGVQDSVLLAGNGTDFALSVPSGGASTATVTAGQPASYTLQVAGQGGFTGPVTFSCTGAPTNSTCSVNPSQAALGSTPTTITVTVATVARSAASAGTLVGSSRSPRGAWLGVLAVGALLGFVSLPKRVRTHPSSLLAIVLMIGLSSCGGGGGGSSTPNVPVTPPVTGTQAGSYTLTLQATSSGVTRNMQITLVVK